MGRAQNPQGSFALISTVLVQMSRRARLHYMHQYMYLITMGHAFFDLESMDKRGIAPGCVFPASGA